MKSLKVLFFLIGQIMFGLVAVHGQTTQVECEALYQKWHQALAANPMLTEPLYFETNLSLPDFNATVMAIEKNKMAMAYFLCEKMAQTQFTNFIANGESRYWQDVHLLREVAEIDLIFPDEYTRTNLNYKQGYTEKRAQVNQAIFKNFRDEWLAGVYKDPSKKIAQLCEESLSKEGGSRIKSDDLTAIRRYGIFGLPELTRQIQKRNSKHAFAAYLIITGYYDNLDYINHTDQQFTNVVDKISHVKKIVDEMKTHTGGDFDVMKKISTALTQ